MINEVAKTKTALEVLGIPKKIADLENRKFPIVSPGMSKSTADATYQTQTAADALYLSLTGGTMSGAISMGGNAITGTGSFTGTTGTFGTVTTNTINGLGPNGWINLVATNGLSLDAGSSDTLLAQGAFVDLQGSDAISFTSDPDVGKVHFYAHDVYFNGATQHQDVWATGDSTTELVVKKNRTGFDGTHLTGIGGKITVTGINTNAADVNYKVEITTGGTASTLQFRWSDDGGSTWDETGVSPQYGSYTMNNGVIVGFQGNFNASDYATFTSIGTNNQVALLTVDSTNGWTNINRLTIGDYISLYGDKAIHTPSASSIGVGPGTLSGYGGTYNTAMGFYALQALTSGSHNSAIGYGSMVNLIQGIRNTAVGSASLGLGKYGGYNTAVGYLSLYNNKTNWGNTAVGTYALTSNTQTLKTIASFSDYSGTVAGTVKATSTSHGLSAGNTDIIITETVNYNNQTFAITATYIDANNFYFTATWAGTETGKFNLESQGKDNTALGLNSGYSITTGSSNTFIGKNAGYNGSQLVTANNSTAIGYGAYTTADNQIVLGNTSVTQIQCNSANILTTGTLGAGAITGTSLIKSGGTSSQFLKADGSVDTSTYYKSGDSPQFNVVSLRDVAGATTGILEFSDGYNSLRMAIGVLDDIHYIEVPSKSGIMALTSSNQNWLTTGTLGAGATTLTSTGTAVIPLTINGYAGQTADLLTVKNSSSVNLFRVEAAGHLSLYNGSVDTPNLNFKSPSSRTISIDAYDGIFRWISEPQAGGSGYAMFVVNGAPASISSTTPIFGFGLTTPIYQGFGTSDPASDAGILKAYVAQTKVAMEWKPDRTTQGRWRGVFGGRVLSADRDTGIGKPTLKFSTNGAGYIDLTSVADYTIQSGDVLEYDIYCVGAIKGAIDYYCSDGTTLRDSGFVDQNGVSSHPTTGDITPYATNTWYHRKISISTHSGKSITKYDIARNDSGAGVYYYKNIVITDGNDNIRKSVYLGGEAITHTPHIFSPTYTLANSEDLLVGDYGGTTSMYESAANVITTGDSFSSTAFLVGTTAGIDMASGTPKGVVVNKGIVTAATSVTPAADGTFANPTSITISGGIITAIS